MLTRIRSAIADFIAPSVRSSPMWDAARPVKRLPEWSGRASSPNAHYDNSAMLRARAEDAYRNNAIARKAVDALVNAAVGASGVNPQIADRAVQAAWERWSVECDASGRLDWAGLESLVLQTVIVSGEAFVTLTVDPAAGEIPLRLQVLGPEYLDTSRTGPNTYAGIEYAGLRPAAYWLFERTPGSVAASLRSVRVPADRCFHVFRPVAAGAQRGQSWLAPVLLALRELMEYQEAALVRAKTAALFCGVIRTRDGGNPLTPANAYAPSMEPGAMVRLQGHDDEVNFTDPPDVGPTFDPFVRAQLRRIAAGMGVPYEILSGDLSAVTFASGRHGLLEFERTIDAIQHGLLVPQLCAPVYRAWLRMARALGVVESDGGRVRWIGPRLAMLDPRADTLATVARVRAGFISRAEAVAQTGWRVEDVDAEIAADNARADNLGLVLDSDPRKVSQQGQTQQEVGAGASA